MPAFFIPHGAGPCFFMEWTLGPRDTWDALGDWLRGLAATLPAAPKAVLVISAHWEAPRFTVNAAHRRGLYYDYQGFPAHTYRLSYPAPGAEDVATQIEVLAANHGISLARDDQRGLDHGVFVPMLLIDPHARLPIVQLSLKEGLDPTEHLRLGRALAPLRERGVLVIGSGSGFHNLRTFGAADPMRAAAFDEWLTDVLCETEPDRRDAMLARWEDAPYARYSHPREEHLLPLMVAAGASPEGRAKRSFHGSILGIPASAYRFD